MRACSTALLWKKFHIRKWIHIFIWSVMITCLVEVTAFPRRSAGANAGSLVVHAQVEEILGCSRNGDSNAAFLVPWKKMMWDTICSFGCDLSFPPSVAITGDMLQSSRLVAATGSGGTVNSISAILNRGGRWWREPVTRTVFQSRLGQ